MFRRPIDTARALAQLHGLRVQNVQNKQAPVGERQFQLLLQFVAPAFARFLGLLFTCTFQMVKDITHLYSTSILFSFKIRVGFVFSLL